ncbi:hypothetical protein DLM77_06030 [Leptospira yasudae]|uniref:Uncharacterized protein n=2 Tax=Leptospira yasudae TaxID=2202201 RepID=A0ABX9M717_9LEPT|nr:hypothetical protein DLM77_06030 [Leptospira yasudae]
MNFRILTLLVLFTLGNIFCSIGTARDACKNNLKASTGAHDCELLSLSAFVPTQNEINANAVAALMLSCYQYYEKLQECNKEEKKYLPAIYSKE